MGHVRLLPTLLAAFSVLLIACIEDDDPPDLFLPLPTVTASATAVPATATPSAITPLSDADVVALMRDAVCWYDDPSAAADCLPPQAATVEAIEAMGASRDPRLIAPLIDMRWLAVGWARWIEEALEALTGRRLNDPAAWYAWAATQELRLPPGYIGWKGRLLSFIDPRYAELLSDDREYKLRPELLIWSRAAPNEVEPLRDPPLVHRVEERYLSEDDVVYGLLLNGESRAYPRRIVSWHEIIEEEVGGEPVVIAFCRPCGGAVAFDPRVGEQRYTLGVSGLIHDSRSLLFDEETGSLWDLLSGRPVAGPLLDQGIELARYRLLTATWSDWSDRHHATFTLDLNTGHVRDYSPGAGLGSETESDTPQYPIVAIDDRLPPEERVVGVVIDGEARAYPASMLRSREVVHDNVGGAAIVLLSEGAGAAIRIYHAAGLEVTGLTENDRDLIASGDDGSDGTRWFVQEDALVSTEDGRRYSSLPGDEFYWFAWAQMHPQTTIWGQ